MFQSACWQVVPGRNTIFSVWAPCNLKDCFYIGGRNPRLWEVHRVTPNKSWAKGEYPWFQQWVVAALCYYPIWAADFFKPAPTAHHFSSIFVENHTCTKAQFFFKRNMHKKYLGIFCSKRKPHFFMLFQVWNKKMRNWVEFKSLPVKKWNNGLLVLLKKKFQFCLLNSGLLVLLKFLVAWKMVWRWSWMVGAAQMGGPACIKVKKLQKMSKQRTKNSPIPRWFVLKEGL